MSVLKGMDERVFWRECMKGWGGRRWCDVDAKGAHTSVSDLKVGGDFGGDGLHSACIAAFTQNMTIEGVAASALSLRGQHQSTVL